jgi:hypothetical protein
MNHVIWITTCCSAFLLSCKPKHSPNSDIIYPHEGIVAKEWPVIDGVSPTREREFVTIPIFTTDPPNGSPFRVALRAKKTQEILDSFLWEGDMGDENAHKLNKAFWSPDGKFVAISMRTGRLSSNAKFFFVENGKLNRLQEPNLFKNILNQLGATEGGPNGSIAPIKWIDNKQLKVEVIGSAETNTGRVPFHFHAILEIDLGKGIVPTIQLKSIVEATSESLKKK